jgi:hypothetical protein
MPNRNRPVPIRHAGTPPGDPVAAGEWDKDIKAYYDAVAEEPVPDRIQALMAALIKVTRH